MVDAEVAIPCHSNTYAACLGSCGIPLVSNLSISIAKPGQ